MALLINTAPFILLVVLWVFFMRQMQMGATRPSPSARARPAS